MWKPIKKEAGQSSTEDQLTKARNFNITLFLCAAVRIMIFCSLIVASCQDGGGAIVGALYHE